MKASPQNVFLIVWIFPLVAPFMVESDIILHISLLTKTMVVANIAFFYYLAIISWLAGIAGDEEYVIRSFGRLDYLKFEKKIHLLFKFWLIVYLVNIIGSGGIPIYWVLTGDVRSYVDFGLPTLGGLANMLRAFCLVACYIIYKYSNFDKNKKKKYLLYGIGFLLTAFVLETGRGNGVVLLLHPIGMHILIQRFNLIATIKWGLMTLVFLFSLGILQVVRYGDGLGWLERYAENAGITNMTGVAALMIPAITYTAVPIVNTDLNVIKAPLIDFSPNYSIQGVVPTFVRNYFFEKNDYGELVNEANNVSSFYIPLLRDFGIIGAIILVCLFQIATFLVYSKAMRGDLFCIFIWPPLFMSVVLSFFSLFFTSLVVLLYPLLTKFALQGCSLKIDIDLSHEF